MSVLITVSKYITSTNEIFILAFIMFYISTDTSSKISSDWVYIYIFSGSSDF